MEWRRRPDSDVWHYCANCTKLPKKGEYATAHEKPSTGEGCNECISKERKENCRPIGAS